MTEPTTGLSSGSPTPEQTRSSDPAQRRILTVLVVAQIIGTIGVGVAPSIGVLLAEDVTDSETWAGLARTASTLGAAFFGLPLGALAARHGRRAALSTGWAAAAAGALLLIGAAQWSSAVLLFPGLLLIGIGSAVALQSRFAATDRALPQHRGRALALIVWVGTLGSVVGPNLGIPGSWISTATGLTIYASAFLIAAAALGAASLIVTIALRPEPLEERAPRTRNRGRTRPFAALTTELRDNTAAKTAAAAIVTAQIVMVTIMTMTPVHLHHHGGSITVIGVTISLHIAGMYALAPVVGSIVDRYSPRTAVTIGLVILGVALGLAAALPDTTAGIVAALIFLGIGWSFVNVAGSTLFAQSLTTSDRARAQGGIDALSNFCGAAAAFLSGPLLALTSFPALALVCGTVLVPLTVLVIQGRQWRGGDEPMRCAAPRPTGPR